MGFLRKYLKKNKEQKLVKLLDEVFRFSLFLSGSHEQAEDITQEVFLKVFRKLDKINADKIKSYTMMTTKNLYLDYYRKNKNIIVKEFDETMRKQSVLSKELNLDFDINKILKKLEPKHRSIIILYYIEGYSYKEISDIEEVSVSAVKSRLHRARDSFYEILKKYETKQSILRLVKGKELENEEF